MRTPLYKIFLGVLSIMMVLGAIIALLGKVLVPDIEVYQSLSWPALVFWIVFGSWGAWKCFHNSHNSKLNMDNTSLKNNISVLPSKKVLMIILRVLFGYLVTFAFALAIGLLLKWIWPNSMVSSLVILPSIILGIVAGYYLPIPKKWRILNYDNKASSNSKAVLDYKVKEDVHEVVFDKQDIKL